jgi:predicted flavoprotein YhiN
MTRLHIVLQAEVTGGGIPLSELNCATCESRKLPVR